MPFGERSGQALVDAGLPVFVCVVVLVWMGWGCVGSSCLPVRVFVCVCGGVDCVESSCLPVVCVVV